MVKSDQVHVNMTRLVVCLRSLSVICQELTLQISLIHPIKPIHNRERACESSFHSAEWDSSHWSSTCVCVCVFLLRPADQIKSNLRCLRHTSQTHPTNPKHAALPALLNQDTQMQNNWRYSVSFTDKLNYINQFVLKTRSFPFQLRLFFWPHWLFIVILKHFVFFENNTIFCHFASPIKTFWYRPYESLDIENKIKKYWGRTFCCSQ